MLNTPPASVHSPPRQMNAESDNETHCSFVLEKKTDQALNDTTIHQKYWSVQCVEIKIKKYRSDK